MLATLYTNPKDNTSRLHLIADKYEVDALAENLIKISDLLVQDVDTVRYLLDKTKITKIEIRLEEK